MFAQYRSPPLDKVQKNPRNVWSKLLAALDAGEAGDFYLAERLLDSGKYMNDLPEEVFAIYRRRLDELRAGQPPLKINIPSDYLSYKDAFLYPPIRTVHATSKHPSPYPFGLALPQFVGARNDASFLHDAATRLGTQRHHAVKKVHILFAPETSADVKKLQTALEAQRFSGSITVTVFADAKGKPVSSKTLGSHLNVMECSVLSDRANAHISDVCAQTDLVVFLSGTVELDALAIERLARLPRVTDNTIQPIFPMPTDGESHTPFTTHNIKDKVGSRYPFRDLLGMNFAVTPALLKRTGLFDTRFQSVTLASRELAFRMYNLGTYFVPASVPKLNAVKDDHMFKDDVTLYTNLSPNHWDRKADGKFIVPKVSMYIPAYNASKYIERCVDSILSQDVEDIEVCISDDGSRDHTLQVLERRYRDEPKVRWVPNPNGGISFASNQAISMSRGIYVGQLDSDDALKPGAVRRLMEYLDEHPEVACCYGSCERIDADDNYVKDEYSWPVFSREKMMVTSIAHHFRMFRRAAWERTTHFREDIVNAVDYDIFLKMSEVGNFHHIDETLYQRRWHGENTSNVNEGFQTSNTYRVQRETLKRVGLEKFWDVHVADPKDPRRVTYRRFDDRKMVMFWPNYSRANPYQKMLYGETAKEVEVCAGTIDAALRMLSSFPDPSNLVFHLHWLNFLFTDVTDPAIARETVDDFLAKLRKFQWKGGKVIWTIHNTISHDTPFHDIEIDLSTQMAEIANVLHFHSETSIEEVAQIFPVPREKVRISQHGNYVGHYPDFVTRDEARDYLDIKETDDVILFLGQVRPYKGVEQLIEVFRNILAKRPNALLVIAGQTNFDPFEDLSPKLKARERARIRVINRFIDDAEMQLFFRAADMTVYPYNKILTSGSLLLALTYGMPVVIPEVGMTREVLEGTDAGVLYDSNKGPDALEEAINSLMLRKDAGTLSQMAQAAHDLGRTLEWPDFAPMLDMS